MKPHPRLPRSRFAQSIGLVLAFLMIGGSGCRPGAEAGKHAGPSPMALHVAAASSLQFVVPELIRAFESVDPSCQVKATYGSSGTFVAQLEHHAPYDLFLAADRDYPESLVRRDLVAGGKLTSYGTGRLVLWVPSSSLLDVEGAGLAALRDPRVKKIALAHPSQAPYGRAAVQAVNSAELTDLVAPRFVMAETLGQAAQFVESGAADVGFLSWSLVAGGPLSGRGRFWLVPAEAHAPLEHAAVIMKHSSQCALAQRFLDFVTSPSGRSILSKHGISSSPGPHSPSEAPQ